MIAERLVNAIHNSDLKKLCPTYSVDSIREKIIKYLETEEGIKMNKDIFDLIYENFKKIDLKPYEVNKANLSKITKYGKWKFDNLYFNSDDNSFYSYNDEKGLYMINPLLVNGNKNSAVSFCDIKGIRRFIYKRKFLKEYNNNTQ
jgi:hypothetical protein